jgi:hypothetical protein
MAMAGHKPLSLGCYGDCSTTGLLLQVCKLLIIIYPVSTCSGRTQTLNLGTLRRVFYHWAMLQTFPLFPYYLSSGNCSVRTQPVILGMLWRLFYHWATAAGLQTFHRHLSC